MSEFFQRESGSFFLVAVFLSANFLALHHFGAESWAVPGLFFLRVWKCDVPLRCFSSKRYISKPIIRSVLLFWKKLRKGAMYSVSFGGPKKLYELKEQEALRIFM